MHKYVFMYKIWESKQVILEEEGVWVARQKQPKEVSLFFGIFSNLNHIIYGMSE